MSNILEELKKYFADTPRAEVLRAWKESKKKAPKCGPTIKEFLEANDNRRSSTDGHNRQA